MRRLILVLAISLGACEDEAEPLGGVDAPCSSDSQCEAGLVCDIHEPRSCQEPHDHPSDGGGGSGGAPPGVGGGGAPGTGGAGGGEPSACEAYCGCMTSACSAIAGYPFADEPACRTACEAFTADELACFGAFCEQAAQAEVGLDHLCEHAWGAEGTAEC